MLLREFLFLILFLAIFAIRQGYNYERDVFKIVGYAGSLLLMYTIFMTNLIILSKTVRRECRGLMFGIFTSSGALGSFSGLTLGKWLRDYINYNSLFLSEMALCLMMVALILITKIYEDKQFERPMKFKQRIMRKS